MGLSMLEIGVSCCDLLFNVVFVQLHMLLPYVDDGTLSFCANCMMLTLSQIVSMGFSIRILKSIRIWLCYDPCNNFHALHPAFVLNRNMINCFLLLQTWHCFRLRMWNPKPIIDWTNYQPNWCPCSDWVTHMRLLHSKRSCDLWYCWSHTTTAT